eukprot:4818869-Amphidinium_carterae.1
MSGCLHSCMVKRDELKRPHPSRNATAAVRNLTTGLLVVLLVLCPEHPKLESTGQTNHLHHSSSGLCLHVWSGDPVALIPHHWKSKSMHELFRTLPTELGNRGRIRAMVLKGL